MEQTTNLKESDFKDIEFPRKIMKRALIKEYSGFDRFEFNRWFKTLNENERIDLLADYIQLGVIETFRTSYGFRYKFTKSYLDYVRGAKNE